MKRNAIARIIIYSILLLVLTGILISAIAWDEYIFEHDASSGVTVESEASVASSEVQCIEIDWAAGAIEIIVADTDQITFTETAPENSKYKMSYTLSDNTLQLNYGEDRVSIGFGSNTIPRKDLLITVPRDWVCEELEIDGAALEIHVLGLEVKTIDLDGAALEVNMDGSFQYLTCDGAGCNLELVSAHCPSEISLDGAGCNLNLTLPADAGFLVQTEGLGCSFSSSLPYSGTLGEYYYGDQQCKMDVDGLGCSITIRSAA